MFPCRNTLKPFISSLLKGKSTFGEASDQSLTLSLSRTDSDPDDTIVAQTGGTAVAFLGTAVELTIDDTVSRARNHGFADNRLLDVAVQLSCTHT